MTKVVNGEILAPAGDRESLEAALAAGAEAVYFGLDEGFNARARASNFRVDGLPELVAQIHRAGARAYLALNTLIFQSELVKVVEILHAVGKAGVDALIVQDPGLALLAQAICPTLEIHASTQMTISSPEAAKFAETLGVTRVVVPRELSVTEIRKFREGTELELEAFIMGALCVSWSGQCLSSEAWGGRSANRGKCAQACRLPYDLVVDGEHRPLGQVEYLLSPQDLAGFRAVEELLDIGVHTLKIEGRQKGASFVHHAVTSLKDWRDALINGKPDLEKLSEDVRDLSLVYSRGLSDGFLAGSDHQSLVEGLTPRHKGLLLGRVAKVDGNKVLVERVVPTPTEAKGDLSSPLPACGGSEESATGVKPAPLEPVNGMGVVFRQGDTQAYEQGGPIFAVTKTARGWQLQFGHPGPDLQKVKPNAQVFITSDPKLVVGKTKSPDGRLPLLLHVSGELNEALIVKASCGAVEVESRSEVLLQEAQKRALSEEVLRENLGALGGTSFSLTSMELELATDLFLPLGELRNIRRDLVSQLEPAFTKGVPKEINENFDLATHLGKGSQPGKGKPYIVALCRTPEQLEAAIEAGVEEVELDWMELVGLNAPVAMAKAAGLRVGLATVRIQKPGEEAFDRRIQKLQPDSVLLRHWAGLMHFLDSAESPTLHADFSLNVTNSITCHHLLAMGLETVTASHDLDQTQLLNLLSEVDPRRVAVTIHHHIPTFHTEHCVYSSLLSDGRDYRSCGRPCEEHAVSLKDRMGMEHPVVVDVGCRNTVFNAQAQSAAFLVPDLINLGVERLRVEFVRESKSETQKVLAAYKDLIDGKIDHQELTEAIGVHEQFGVTRGTMEILV